MKNNTGLAQLSPLAVTHCSMPPIVTKPDSSTLPGLPLHAGDKVTLADEADALVSSARAAGFHTAAASTNASIERRIMSSPVVACCRGKHSSSMEPRTAVTCGTRHQPYAREADG